MKDLPNRSFELRPVRGVDLKIGLKGCLEHPAAGAAGPVD